MRQGFNNELVVKEFVISGSFVRYNFTIQSKKAKVQKKDRSRKNQASTANGSPRLPNNERNKNRKVFLFFCIIIVTIIATTGVIVYLLSQEGVLEHIIGSALAVLAASDIALIQLLHTENIKLKLRRKIKLSEAEYDKGVYFSLVSITAVILMFSVIVPFITPWIQGNEVTSVQIAGRVSCENEQVEGIWVDAVKGGSGFADWWESNNNGSEAGFKYVLPNGGGYNLHVGCGGSKQNWGRSYTTEDGTGTLQDHNSHYFTCIVVPLEIGYGSCRLEY